MRGEHLNDLMHLLPLRKAIGYVALVLRRGMNAKQRGILPRF